MTYIGISILLILFVLLFALYKIQKVWETMQWLLRHVHVVSKQNEKDPELKAIKRVFGIEDD